MNVSIIIPQLFYDLIGRIVPGAALIACAFILSNHPASGLHSLTSWSDSLVVILLGNLLAAHIIGSLLGGIWFRVYRLNLWWREGDNPCRHSSWLRWLHGWAKIGEIRLDEAFVKTFEEEMPEIGLLKLETMKHTGRVALIYDYLQLRCPKAGARIAKLRAEQHMSGVLMIGSLLLAAIYFFFPYLINPYWSVAGVQIALLFSALTAAWLAWHLEKRASTALFFCWYLVWSGNAEESGGQDA
jgi:hypothetical protein